MFPLDFAGVTTNLSASTYSIHNCNLHTPKETDDETATSIWIYVHCSKREKTAAETKLLELYSLVLSQLGVIVCKCTFTLKISSITNCQIRLLPFAQFCCSAIDYISFTVCV